VPTSTSVTFSPNGANLAAVIVTRNLLLVTNQQTEILTRYLFG
jgi:hypothetical protein